MTAQSGTVTSEYKVKLYTQWIEHFMSPLSNRAKLQGRLYEPVLMLEGHHKKITEQLRTSLASANRMRQEFIERDPEYYRVKHILSSSTFLGGMGALLGPVVPLALVTINPPIAAGMLVGFGLGGALGARSGNQIANEDINKQSYGISLQKFQEVFEEEINWIEDALPQVERELKIIDGYLRQDLTLSNALKAIVEKTQLVALRTHFNFVLDQHQKILNLPILDPKPCATSWQEFFEYLISPDCQKFLQEQSKAHEKEFERQRELRRMWMHDSNRSAFYNNVAAQTRLSNELRAKYYRSR